MTLKKVVAKISIFAQFYVNKTADRFVGWVSEQVRFWPISPCGNSSQSTVETGDIDKGSFAQNSRINPETGTPALSEKEIYTKTGEFRINWAGQQHIRDKECDLDGTWIILEFQLSISD